MLQTTDQATSAPRTFVFLLLDSFAMMSLTCAIEPLRSLNRLVGREAFAWRLARVGDGPVHASNGLPFDAQPALEVLAGAEVLFVCGGLRIEVGNERAYHSVLRRAARLGVSLGALSTGGYMLARAGLLDGYRCTLHWENRMAFKEEFPGLNCTDKIYEIDRNRLTCSGGVASMDLMLRLIGDAHGHALAQRVAHQFHHDRIRNEEEEQRGGRADLQNNLPTLLRSALHLMESRLDDPMEIPGIASHLDISLRHLERMFQQYLGTSPVRYYISLRVARARELLLYSDRSVLDIAVATGFSSTSHFSHWFKQAYGSRPTEFRKTLPGQRAPAQR